LSRRIYATLNQKNNALSNFSKSLLWNSNQKTSKSVKCTGACNAECIEQIRSQDLDRLQCTFKPVFGSSKRFPVPRFCPHRSFNDTLISDCSTQGRWPKRDTLFIESEPEMATIEFGCRSVTQSAQSFWGAKMFGFSRETAFCLEYRPSKHKMTRYSKNLGGMNFYPPHWLRLCCRFQSSRGSKC